MANDLDKKVPQKGYCFLNHDFFNTVDVKMIDKIIESKC